MRPPARRVATQISLMDNLGAQTWLSREFHPFSSGRPSGLLYQQLSLDNVPAGDRYAFFGESVVYGFSLDCPDPAQRQDFRAGLVSMADADCAIHYARTDSFAGRECSDPHEPPDCSLFLVRSGRVDMAAAGGRPSSATAGQIICTSSAASQHLKFTRPEVIEFHLNLPPAAFGSRRLLMPGEISRTFNRSGLCPVLRAKMNAFPAAAAGMDHTEQAIYLATLHQLVLLTLQTVIADAVDTQWQNAGLALFEAACQYIDAHLHRPTLGPDSLAAALGCSRATLYRAFKGREEGVAGLIRCRRLDRAYALLCAGTRLAVGDVAACCGFENLRTFQRAFRTRFDDTPAGVRDRHHSRSSAL